MDKCSWNIEIRDRTRNFLQGRGRQAWRSILCWPRSFLGTAMPLLSQKAGVLVTFPRVFIQRKIIVTERVTLVSKWLRTHIYCRFFAEFLDLFLLQEIRPSQDRTKTTLDSTKNLTFRSNLEIFLDFLGHTLFLFIEPLEVFLCSLFRG